MNKVSFFSVVVILCALLTGLSSGCAYMHVRRPLSVEYDKTELGTKQGRANAYSILWLFSWGDAGNKAAATKGGLTTINCADLDIEIILFGLYLRSSTVVYGD